MLHVVVTTHPTHASSIRNHEQCPQSTDYSGVAIGRYVASPPNLGHSGSRHLRRFEKLLDPEGGSPNATLVVLVLLVVVISFLKIPKAFLICSGAQRNFAYTFVLTFRTGLPCQIFKLVSN